jgi:hypothetical protein
VHFDLNGQDYECLPQLPAGYSFDLLMYGNRKAAEFFDVILTEESAERFNAAIRDATVVVPQATVDEIIRWLVEVYTGRPTGPSNGSSNGASTIEATSTP